MSGRFLDTLRQTGDFIVQSVTQAAESANRAGFERCRRRVLELIDDPKQTVSDDVVKLRRRIVDLHWEDR
jgi:hypothetical protein